MPTRSVASVVRPFTGDTRMIPLLDLKSADANFRATLLALNNNHAAELSWLDPNGLDHLIGQAFRAGAIGAGDAFMIALDQSADYGSPNFKWFRDRYDRFAYVDRVVVSPAARGGGLARRLYADLFAVALETGHTRIVCEVNADPPNPASDAFHRALGFSVVGEASIYGGQRSVRYYLRPLTAQDR